ncbi:MAG: hypothetical protein H0V82_00265 [Candidatus Protochlamydia sp.]|nr:hypothetical protein [Candidatus Protochlamydia sp.]
MKKEVLICQHTFHKECIVEWLKRKHNCPICRAKIEIPSPEARQEVVLAIPDHHPYRNMDYEEMLQIVQNVVLQNRQVRRLHLSHNVPVENTA